MARHAKTDAETSTPADSAHFPGILKALAVDTDKETGANATSPTLALVRGHDLTP